MTFSDEELTLLQSGVANLGIFFRLDVEPEPVRIWLGFGAIEPGVNVFDPAGARYLGMRVLLDVPQISQLLNGAAERVEFVLSGVAGAVATIASGDDAEQVKGRAVVVGFALMGVDFQLIGPVHWLAYYVADFLGGEQVAAAGGLITRTLTLSCGTRFTGRRRPSFSYYSDADQQARFPGDTFCDFTGKYAHGFSKKWPIF
ncbi:hypothetical protein [Bradyrhizobium sp. I71]|uniref:hypothetical protein n=1 Tax=Bradyrhizobium sp. I71 TaxID=2590772 RepID=UPI001EF88349|nr:hypothetical protein [Bradyrhizobium sp. I71]ULK98838.1 hypothetical protein FJV43_03585 [Bradyrhizobium sp. I71]